MTKNERFDRIVTILHDSFEIEPARITPEARLYDDLDIDSIDAVDLLVQLKQITGVRLQPEAFKSVRTLRDVLDDSPLDDVTTLQIAKKLHDDGALQTVTTVGYGDLVPQTPAARMFAIALMILGVSMIALLSASLVSYFQAEEEREAARVRRQIWSKLQQIESEAEDRAQHNEALLNRLAAIELALVRAVEHRSALEQKIERLLDRQERDETVAGTKPRTGDDHGIDPTAPPR